jgi:hypothetical protein
VSSKRLSRMAAPAAPPPPLPGRTAAEVAPSSSPADGGQSVPPLHWWRRLPAEAFTAAHLQTIRKATSGIGIIGEPRWADAVRGDPAAAVGVALSAIKKRRTLAPIVDLTMSTLLIPAIAGDPAAIMVLVKMIERKCLKAEKTGLKSSWLRHQRKPSTSRSTVAKISPRCSE